MNRRTFLAGIAAGGIVVGGELWFPGQKLISIPKIIKPNNVSFKISGLGPTPDRIHTIAKDWVISYNVGHDTKVKLKNGGWRTEWI
jgi:hypothetical protein